MRPPEKDPLARVLFWSGIALFLGGLAWGLASCAATPARDEPVPHRPPGRQVGAEMPGFGVDAAPGGRSVVRVRR